MQMAQGAPGDMVPVVAVGLLPMAGRALGSTGTSMVNWRRNFPSVSKTWMRRLDVLERLGTFVGGFLLAAENHDDAAFGVELDDHVGAFVGGPNVVVPIDFDGVGEGPGVEMV